MRRIAAGVAILAMAVGGLGSDALARKPKPPPGRDPGGIAIAIVTTGIDYAQPAIAARLARDGEGELIGWDMVDGDNRPHAASPSDTPGSAGGDGTHFARDLAFPFKTRLVPIRVAAGTPAAIAQAITFAARTPARVVLVPMTPGTGADWHAYASAAASAVAGAGDLIVILVADGNTPVDALSRQSSDHLLMIASTSAAGADIGLPIGTGATTPSTPAATLIRFSNALAACADFATGRTFLDNRAFSRLIAILRATGASNAGTVPGETCGLRALRP